MAEPLAYFITWTTYGTWLPGDERGWIEEGRPGIQAADPSREERARERLTEPPVTLDPEERRITDATIRAHCGIRHWILHALNVRTNHVHVVVSAPETLPERVMDQFKAWCTRRLNERGDACGKPGRRRWWTKHGSTKWLNDEDDLHRAIRYVQDMQ